MSNKIFFKIKKNRKDPAQGFKNLTKSVNVNMKYYNKALKTGKQTNITVIDLDIYKGLNSDDFVSEFGKNFIKEFDTYTQRTPNGGYHLFFEYEEDIRQTQTDAIDVRNDGGYIIVSPSSIDGKFYEVINDVKIKKMPVNLKEWLLDNLYTKQEKERIINGVKKPSVNEGDYKYNDIPDQLLETVLEDLPENYVDGKDWWKFTSFMKAFDKWSLWDKISEKSNKYKRTNNYKIWDSMKYYDFTFQILKDCGSSLIDLIKFKPIKDVLPTPNKKVDVRYISEGLTINKKRNYIIKSDTGTGKTTLFKKYCRDKGLKFLSICSRVSLADEQERTFSEYDLSCVHYKDVKKGDFIDDLDSYITQVDSIEKFNTLDVSDHVIFLDEFNSLIEYIFKSSTLNRNRLTVLTTLTHFLKNCKQVIATDADISSVCFKLFDYCDLDYKFVKNTHNHNKNVKAYEVETLTRLIEDIKKCKKFIVCCDSKKIAEKIFIEIGEMGKLYTSDNNEKLDINEHDQLIFSPKIVYGLDSNINRKVFCVFRGNTISPSNMLQQINRERQITEVCFYFENRKSKMAKFSSKKECVEYIKETNKSALKQFEITNSGLNDMFIDILQDIEYKFDCFDTNKYAHFIHLMRKRGFEVSPLYTKNEKVKKSELKVVKEWQEENFDIANFNNLNQILKLVDDEDINKYKPMFLEPQKLMNHFYISTYLLKDTEEDRYIKRLDGLKDFPIKKYQQDYSKMNLLKKFEKMTKTERDDKIECQKGLSKEKSKEMNKSFKEVYGFKRKDVDYTDKTECTQQLIKCYKQLFGDIVKTKRKRIEGERITEYKMGDLESHQYLMDKRKKIDNFNGCLIE